MNKTFVGFGFGAIQAGLFIPEAFKSGNFSRLVVSEIDQSTVNQIRKAHGSYVCNVAESSYLRFEEISGLEIYNPLVPADREKLLEAIASANELCTALPSYTLYDSGEDPVASLLAEGIQKKLNNNTLPPAVVYAAENDGRAAFRLSQVCKKYLSSGFEERVSFSETVIAKMCSVVLDPDRISDEKLREVTIGSQKSFLVEAFDQILIEERAPYGFERGITQFITKPDLDPFALTKFHGHNAIHYCLGLEAKERGLRFMHQAAEDKELMKWAKETFLEEAGVGLRNKFKGFPDELFSEDGFINYVEDALARMVNPFLRDPIERVTRDPKRKLGWNDRLIGSIRFALIAGINPWRMIGIAQKGLREIMSQFGLENPKDALDLVWEGAAPIEEAKVVRKSILESHLDV